MSDEKPKRAAMRRMHEQILRSGVMARLGSEARLVLCYALCWADYGSCTFVLSARGAAKVCGCQTTSFRRGIRELEAAGVIGRGPETRGGRTKWVFRCPAPAGEGAHVACQGARTLRDRGRARSVTGGAHVACRGRARSVSGGAHATCSLSRKVSSDPSRDQKGNRKPLAGSAAVAAPARPVSEESTEVA